jgi:hypothetical protein
MYPVMYLVSLVCKVTANMLTVPAQEDSMADAWIRQRERLREAIAQAKSGNAAIEPARADDDCVGAWARQQARLTEAIARAKHEHQAGSSRGARGPGDEHSSQ